MQYRGASDGRFCRCFEFHIVQIKLNIKNWQISLALEPQFFCFLFFCHYRITKMVSDNFYEAEALLQYKM